MESKLVDINNRSLSQYGKKKLMMERLFELKICIARYLVAYRCKKVFTEQKLAEFTESNELISNVKTVIRRLSLLFDENVKNYVFHFTKLSNDTPVHFFPKYIIASALSPIVLPIQGQFIFKDRYAFFKSDVYSIILKLMRNNKFRIHSLFIYWPKTENGFEISSKYILSKFYNFDFANSHMFEKFDSIIREYFLFGQYKMIIMATKSFSEQYKFKLIRDKNEFILNFYQFLGNKGIIRLFLRNKRIFFASQVPLYNVSNQCFNVSYGDQKSESIFGDPSIFFQNVSNDKKMIESIICLARNSILLTQIVFIWKITCKAIALSNGWIGYNAQLICKDGNVSTSKIILSIMGVALLTIKVSPETGKVITTSSLIDGLHTEELPFAYEQGPNNVKDVLTSFVVHYVSTTVFSEITGNQSILFCPNSIFHDFPTVFYLSFVFSFANSYNALTMYKNNHYSMMIVSDDKQIKTMRTVEFNHIQTKKNSNNMISFLKSVKALISLMNIEDILKTNGFFTFREHSTLTVTIKPYMKAHIKIRENGSWRIRIEEQAYRYTRVNSIVLNGKHYSMRFCGIINHLIHILLYNGNLGYCLSGVTRLSSFNSSVNRYSDTYFTIRIGNSSLTVSLGEKFSIPIYESQFNSVYEMRPPNIPSLSLTVNPSSTIDLSGVLANTGGYESFGAMARNMFIPIVKLRLVFSDQSWVLSSINLTNSFYLVYRKKVTLNIQLKPLGDLAVVIPSFGISSNLCVPLFHFPPLFKTISLSHNTYRVHIDQAEIMKELIDHFFNDCRILGMHAFSSGKLGQDNLEFKSDICNALASTHGIVLQSTFFPDLSSISSDLKGLLANNRVTSRKMQVVLIQTMKLDKIFFQALLDIFKILLNLFDKEVDNWVSLVDSVKFSSPTLQFIVKSKQSNNDQHIMISLIENSIRIASKTDNNKTEALYNPSQMPEFLNLVEKTFRIA